jgi:hypothetical protein
MYEAIDEYMAESKRLVATLNQAVADYMSIVETHGKDPMTEASLAAFSKTVEAQSAMVAHLEKAPGRK